MTDDKIQKKLDDGGENLPVPLGTGPATSIEVKNLIVAPMARKSTLLGDVLSLNRAVDKNEKKILALVWNEEGISLDLDDSTREIAFQPEIKPQVAMFFQRETKRERLSLFEEGARVWEGDFEPVKFGKRNFLKFIKAHMTQIPADVADAMKRLKLSDLSESNEALLDEESDNEERIERTIQTTNLPTQFSAMMPIAENFDAELHFETKVYKSQEYGSRGKTVVEVRCTNARQVLRDMMEGVLSQLPPEIPRYYGKMQVLDGHAK